MRKAAFAAVALLSMPLASGAAGVEESSNGAVRHACNDVHFRIPR